MMDAPQEEKPQVAQLIPPPSLIRRIGAFLIDQLLVNIVAGFCLAPFVMHRVGRGFPDALRLQLQTYVAFVLPQTVAFVYFAFMHSAWRKSLGKMVCGMHVTIADGSGVTRRKAVVRAFWSSGICALPLAALPISPAAFKLALLGVILYALANAITILTNPEQRALHDIIVGSRVIPDNETK